MCLNVCTSHSQEGPLGLVVGDTTRTPLCFLGHPLSPCYNNLTFSVLKFQVVWDRPPPRNVACSSTCKYTHLCVPFLGTHINPSVERPITIRIIDITSYHSFLLIWQKNHLAPEAVNNTTPQSDLCL